MIKIERYLDPSLVVFLKSNTRDEAIHDLINHLEQVGRLEDKQAFVNAITEREKIVSTGIGMGVSIPHAKLPGYEDFFIGIGVLSKGVDWNAIDGSQVRLIFMIGGPDDKQTEYLQILSSLTMMIKDEQIRKKLLTQNSPNAIIELFKK